MADAAREVAFLFTDVEASTALARKLGAEFAGVLEAQRRLIQSSVEEHGGHAVDAKGDELFAAFHDTRAAVSAAVEAQRALAGHDWPPGGMPRVRMGIHAGEAEPNGSGYVGLDVHRAARVSEAAVGGQILLSSVARARVADGDFEFADLGEHRLHGFPDRERLFSVLHEHLPDELRAATAAGEPRGDKMRVVLADDSVLLREGIAKLLDEAGFDVAGQSGTADDLLLKVRSYKPDVAIVDIRMPPTHTDEGLRAAKEIRERHPGVGVLVLSQYVEAGYALELLQGSAEGVGYLLKDRVADVSEFADAVRRVGDGGSALDPTVVSRLVGRRRGEDPLDALTPREREVLELMAEGRSNQAIAEKLVVTPRAVEKHVTSIFTKLGLPASAEDHRRVLAVVTYLNA